MYGVGKSSLRVVYYGVLREVRCKLESGQSKMSPSSSLTIDDLVVKLSPLQVPNAADWPRRVTARSIGSLDAFRLGGRFAAPFPSLAPGRCTRTSPRARTRHGLHLPETRASNSSHFTVLPPKNERQLCSLRSTTKKTLEWLAHGTECMNVHQASATRHLAFSAPPGTVPRTSCL